MSAPNQRMTPQSSLKGSSDDLLPNLLGKQNFLEVQDKCGKAGDFKDFVDLGSGIKKAYDIKKAAVDAAAATDVAADAATGAAAAADGARVGGTVVNAAATGGKALECAGAAAACLKICTSGYALLCEEADPEKVSEKLQAKFKQLLEEFQSEPASLARTAMMKELEELYAEAWKLGVAKENQHTGSHGATVLAGFAGVAAFFTAVPSAPVLLFGLLVDAQDWRKQSELRRTVMNLIDKSVIAEVKYAKTTGRRKQGLLGTPGEFSYSGSMWCKTLMLVEFQLHDGQLDKRSSLDCEKCDSFEGKMILPPGAINVKITFDVWGGATVDAVNRRSEDFEWLEGPVWRNAFYGYRQQEVFTFPKGDDMRAEFKLEGTSLHRYVEEATATNIKTKQKWLL